MQISHPQCLSINTRISLFLQFDCVCLALQREFEFYFVRLCFCLWRCCAADADTGICINHPSSLTCSQDEIPGSLELTNTFLCSFCATCGEKIQCEHRGLHMKCNNKWSVHHFSMSVLPFSLGVQIFAAPSAFAGKEGPPGYESICTCDRMMHQLCLTEHDRAHTHTHLRSRLSSGPQLELRV